MIALLAGHIIITLLCCWTGFLLYRVLGVKTAGKSIVLFCLTGLVGLTLIAQIGALFMPIDCYFELTILALFIISLVLGRVHIGGFAAQCFREIQAMPSLAKAAFVMLWLVVLMINAGPAMMDDTESYHIQMTMWIREYGSVPGLANLHDRFGFNSSWFSAIALLNTPGSNFTMLNGVISVWFCFYLLSIGPRLMDQHMPAAVFAIYATLIGSMLIWPMTRGNAATANYDFITLAMVFILFLEVHASIKSRNAYLPGIEWVIWPAFLFTVRIINFPLLLLAVFAFYFVIRKNAWREKAGTVLIVLALIIPFLARNYIISGYLFYPAAYFDLNADWKTDPVQMNSLVEYIKYYNRVSTTYLDIEQTKELGAGWIPHWFRYLFRYDKIILITGVAGFIVEALSLAFRKFRAQGAYLVFLLVALCSFISWFVIAPDPRFVYGFLLIGSFLLIYRFCLLVFTEAGIRPFIILAQFAITGVVGTYLFAKLTYQPHYRNWVQPHPLPQPPVQELTVDGITFKIPDKINNNWNARCFGTSLPCLYKIDPRLRARGKTIREGFRLQK